ncbi:hypothetical protein Val02_58520 [Virgisporangium aliadipatigenens]|uniref:SMP-30/Gluconolactonase/LRE-like region domain-containing protein n=1 Tax=Virgisporangium aliadipatigenens TaxID=741659 RepID=A0A8J3YSE5_9ACTN|nr:hypothetical protein [Virgisporangium aliadipatigenens]GIJ48966.1 hypothetical protein Val02_58520 [Virgisporangium aliadipatigenens]
MIKRFSAALTVLCAAFAVSAVAAPAASAETRAPRPDTLTIPGDNYYPESISAAAGGDLYVGSIVTGAVVRFRPGVWTSEEFLPAGTNIGTAGVLVDDARKVLWTCNIDLSFQTPTSLRAFSLATGERVAEYVFPDRGVCADLALVGGAVFATDTTDPTASPALPGRILRLTTPSGTSAKNGTLSVWSADPLLTGGQAGLQINGIAYDGRGTVFVTNYSSGKLVKVRLSADGSAGAAAVIPLDRAFVNPDGIRMLDAYRLLVTENPGRLSTVDVRTGVSTVVSDTVDQPTSVVRVGRDLWVAEGQVLRLQRGEAPRIPFTVRRVPAPFGW